MQTFKTKAFARFAAREGLEDTALCEAIRRARGGLIDADLGGGVIKQRIARKGSGRSGGFRMIVLFRRGALAAFFVYGFAKSDRENLRRDELETYRLLADRYLALDEKGLTAAQAAGAIVEVKCDDQTIQE
ncbi:MAG: type II toxin-antitoxin system RelE/ParE family toxin [Chloroflexi bacterium]|nr:type II toxin-antitoxin system RelE/ParE family toxin [Chloroflexota bacterium]